MLAPADEDAELPPYVVPAGRAVPLPYNGSVARIAFGPVSTARVRRWLARGDVRRAARARADHAEPVAAGGAVRARPGGGHLPHRDDPLPGARRRRGHAAAGDGEDHRPDRGQRAGPQGAGGAPRRRRGGDPQRGRGGQVRRGRAAAGLARRRAARSASWAASPSRARASTILRTAFVTLARQRPGLRLLVAGPGDRGRPVRRRAGRPARPDRVPGPGQRGGQGPDAAQRGRLRGAEHRRRVVRHDPHRGDGGRHQRSRPATWTRSAGCWTAAGPARSSRPATRRRWPACCGELLDDPARRDELADLRTDRGRGVSTGRA